ncbi:MAG: polyribonucleotide nucleotidyltransferase [Oscillospiraceae bacterium]|jgi:polyribonucleotide nucleotidyltransferase|nr:polyribonucleotide nucleotidyltransferase [Oscillospiraceae bacterium]
MLNQREFPSARVFETTLGGRRLAFEIGRVAELAGGACLVRYGETTVLVTATAAQNPRQGIDYFPLSVDFEERLYSVGRIPGSFLRREGRPSERAILASRLIDRPLRPLFPSDMRNDVSVAATIMSLETDCAPEIPAMLGASVALVVSDIPWNGPIAGVVLGMEGNQFVVNPTAAQREKSPLNLTVAGTAQKVVMIEAGAKEVTEDVMFDAIQFAHEEIKKLVAFIAGIAAELGKPKMTYAKAAFNQELHDELKAVVLDRLRVCLDTDDKNIREARLSALKAELAAEYGEKYADFDATIGDVLYKLQKHVVRRWLLDENKRVDGRGLLEVRPLAAEVGLLPRAHGSGLFTRGQTQVLTVATLGTISDQQKLDNIFDDETKRFMHHYNFPSYSVGEARPSRGPGRREIGHGALAERALEAVIPDEEAFPYCIRLVSEVLSSNGSTSQGSVCGSTLALMDAGVPIKAPVAGISSGLVTEGDRWLTFVDIQGVEDFYGDMDFKVAGTKTGITAIQMDLKTDGLTPEVIRSALTITRDARYGILDEIMLPCIAKPREELSKYAPKMLQTTIDPEKIREVIGKGGSVIQKITAETNTKIDIEDDGRIFISAQNRDDCQRALAIIEAIVLDPQIGDIFYGRVTRLMTFGAFVEFAPGKEGLIHISKLAAQRVAKVEDVVNIGDMTWVKVVEVDEKGRINLSRKDALSDLEKRGQGAAEPPKAQ